MTFPNVAICVRIVSIGLGLHWLDLDLEGQNRNFVQITQRIDKSIDPIRRIKYFFMIRWVYI